MISALIAVIFGITGGVALSLAVPAQEKPPVLGIQPANSFPDYGEPLVPQIEQTPPQEAPPQPMDRYLVGQKKTEKSTPRRHRHIVRPQPNFFEKLFAGFMKLQKRPVAKPVYKRSRTTSRANARYPQAN